MGHAMTKYAPLEEKIKLTVIQPSPAVKPEAAHRACARANGKKHNPPMVQEVEVTRNELDESFNTTDLYCCVCKRAF